MRKYVYVELIGGGGFADVWRVVLEGTQQEFAVKVLRDFRNLDARHRFEREVRMLRGLRHPRVIQLVEANISAERPFYVMPLMRGALTAWAGRLPPENIRIILLQLLDFLVYLHGQGGLHRDIKPDNLLVDAAGNLAVGDFGLGNNPKYTVMMTANAVGTWGYIAPELMKPDAKATAAADIYSLGATIFHLTTGIHPQNADSLDPWFVRSDVPADIRSSILQMVQPDPSLRPSASMLRDALTSRKPPQVRTIHPHPLQRPSRFMLPTAMLPRPPEVRRPPADDGLKVLVGAGILALIIAALSS